MATTTIRLAIGLVSIGLFVFCDYTATRWAERLGSEGVWTWRLLWVSIAAPLGMIAFGLVGVRFGLASMSCFVNTGVVAGGVLVGVLLRGERLSALQKFGLAFGLLALILLNQGQADEPS